MSVWVLASPSAAQPAAPLPRLSVHRAPEAADCPDAPALAAAVERLMTRPALDPDGGDRVAPVYEVQILRVDDGYTAILHAGERARQISDAGPGCGELFEALALTLSILLDSDAPPRPLPPPPPASPPPASPAPPAAPRPPPDKAWALSLEIGAAQTTGLITPLSGAFVGELSLRLPWGSVGAGVIVLPARSIDFAPGIIDISLVAATARGCAAVLGDIEGPRASVCFEPMLGALRGAGSGYSPDREGSVPWFALGGGAIAEGPLFGRLGWSTRAMLVVPVTLESFTVDRIEGGEVRQAVAFEPSPVGFLLGLGLSGAIW